MGGTSKRALEAIENKPCGIERWGIWEMGSAEQRDTLVGFCWKYWNRESEEKGGDDWINKALYKVVCVLILVGQVKFKWWSADGGYCDGEGVGVWAREYHVEGLDHRFASEQNKRVYLWKEKIKENLRVEGGRRIQFGELLLCFSFNLGDYTSQVSIIQRIEKNKKLRLYIQKTSKITLFLFMDFHHFFLIFLLQNHN